MNLADQPAADQAAIIGALIDRLPDYLASDGLFLPVLAEHGGQRDSVTLTLGVLLDALDGLSAVNAAAAAPLISRLHEVAAQRGAAYADKLRHELRSAVAVWRSAADDLAHEPERADDVWRDAARQRTRAAQLLDELARVGAAVDAAAQATLASADAAAKPRTVPAAFAGAKGDAARFPAESHWWLWRRPESD
ncbi:MAG: hypothetical protein ABI780_00945 [Ardenticatenales bacterium]